MLKKDEEIRKLNEIQESNENEILDMSHKIRYLMDESEDRKEIIIVKNRHGKTKQMGCDTARRAGLGNTR